MKKIISILFALILPVAAAVAQKYNQNWFFGNRIILNFNFTPPQVSNANLAGVAGTAAISNFDGQLLFYTNGTYVINRAHEVMPGGSNILGHDLTAQTALIIPDMADSNLYYLFTLPFIEAPPSMKIPAYTKIDMRLDNGYGGVVSGEKNVQYTTERYCYSQAAASAPDCMGVWLIHHDSANTFIARLISDTGIGQPVHSVTGEAIREEYGLDFSEGRLKVSPDNKKLIINSRQDNGGSVLARFNNLTGEVSDPIYVNSRYSACFSPDSKKLYTLSTIPSAGYEIYQYDIETWDQNTIANSRTLVGQVFDSSTEIADMALAPDGRIYSTQWLGEKLPYIMHPNIGGEGCGFVYDGLHLNKLTYFGLPTEVRYPIGPTLFLGNDTTVCFSDSLVLSAPADFNRFRWSTGDTTQSIKITQSGTYILKAYTEKGCMSADTITVKFANLFINLGDDKLLCPGDSVLLFAGIWDSVAWNTGSDYHSIKVGSPGLYTVDAWRLGCHFADSIRITFLNDGNIFLQNIDTTLCEGDRLHVLAPAANSYQWSTGDTTQAVEFSESGLYTLTLSNGTCTATDSIKIAYSSPPPIFWQDTAVCEQENIMLNPPAALSYLWQDSSQEATYLVNQPGNYSVRLEYLPGCYQTYSVDVTGKSCTCQVYVPNAFTPNSDGLNDRFRPLNTQNCHIINFTVYNRGGEIVYRYQKDSSGWDGMLRGKYAQPGTYTWYMRIWINGRVDFHSGTVILLR